MATPRVPELLEKLGFAKKAGKKYDRGCGSATLADWRGLAGAVRPIANILYGSNGSNGLACRDLRIGKKVRSNADMRFKIFCGK